MNVKFLNPFVDAAYEVLKTETHAEVQRGDLSLDQGNYHTDDLTVIISLVGAVEGTVFYSMDETTAIKVGSILLGEPYEELDYLTQSGIAELGNVITGRASMKLAEAGYESTISPPSLILGRGATISTLDYPRLVVPLVTIGGRIIIHLALRQGKNSQFKTPQIAIPKAPGL
jgi:chemotaxis protein CheX